MLKITRPEYKFSWRSLLHFSPLLLEQAALALEIRESSKTGAVTYITHTFQQLNPVLQLLIFISIITYLHLSDKLIQKFYRRLQPVLMDRPLLEFRWLRRLLAATALLWLLWLFCAAVDYFGYRNQLGIHVYYPFYIFFVVIIIWTAAAAFLKPQAAMMAQQAAPVKPPVPAELRAKGTWLKKAMEANQYYQDPDLSLSSLNWLQQYDYRTSISAWVFVASGVGALVITLITVSFQAIKAALANPAKSLRTD